MFCCFCEKEVYLSKEVPCCWLFQGAPFTDVVKEVLQCNRVKCSLSFELFKSGKNKIEEISVTKYKLNRNYLKYSVDEWLCVKVWISNQKGAL